MDEGTYKMMVNGKSWSWVLIMGKFSVKLLTNGGICIESTLYEMALKCKEIDNALNTDRDDLATKLHSLIQKRKMLRWAEDRG